MLIVYEENARQLCADKMHPRLVFFVVLQQHRMLLIRPPDLASDAISDQTFDTSKWWKLAVPWTILDINFPRTCSGSLSSTARAEGILVCQYPRYYILDRYILKQYLI